LIRQQDSIRYVYSMYYAGIDAGSVFTKVAILDDEGTVTYAIRPSGRNYQDSIRSALNDALTRRQTSINDIRIFVTTGYGASAANFPNKYMSDITCMAKGVSFLFPNAKTFVEVGGQVSKVVRIAHGGGVIKFVSGDRCAGGSGRFLQVVSMILNLSFEEMCRLSLEPGKRIKFSTSCAVFAETEVISRIAEGATPEEILAGIRESIANRITNMANRVNAEEDCVVCGGGAKDIGLVKMVEEKLGLNLFVPFEPLICGAIGAAAIGKEICLESEEE